MKKIQIIFAASALLLASAGVFANNLAVTTYYWTISQTVACTNVLSTSTIPPNCTTGNSQCTTTETVDGEATIVFLSRKIDNQPCEKVPHL